jgi:DNA-binding MarR family transcriptional regulator
MQQGEKSALVDNILHTGEVLFQALLPTIPREVLEMDLTMTQLKVVLLLFLNGPSRMSTLASGLGVTLATATGVMDRLVEKGFVSRQNEPGDRRVVLCRLTDTGYGMLSRMWQSAKNMTRVWLETVEPSRLQQLAEALESVCADTLNEGKSA